jgi:hypothetical protein
LVTLLVNGLILKNKVMGKISGPCKAAAKKKFEVWPSAYASGWGVRCTKAGGPGKMGKKNQAKKIEGHIKAMQQMSKKKK